MVNVCIQKELFPAGESLFEILTMRMASVQWRETNTLAAKADADNTGTASQPIDAFLCRCKIVNLYEFKIGCLDGEHKSRILECPYVYNVHLMGCQ